MTADAWTKYRPQPSAQVVSLLPEGGRLSTADGVVTLDFPAKAIEAALELGVQVVIPAEPRQKNGEFRWLTLDVTPRDPARAVDGHLRLAQPVTLTFDLTGFPAWLEPYLVHQVDAKRDVWEFLPAHYDTVAVYDYNNALLNSTRYAFITTADVNRGKTTQTLISDTNGALLQQQDTVWGVASTGSTTFGYTDRVTTTHYSGGVTIKNAVNYDYDAYGNVTEEYQYGAVGANGDERTILRRYYNIVTAIAAGKWFIGRQWKENVYAGLTIAETALKTQTFWYYDDPMYNVNNFIAANPPTVTLTQGKLTMRGQGKWSEYATPGRFILTKYVYDAWGNVTQEIDPNGNTMTTTYETTYRQFPTQVCRDPNGLNLCTLTRYYGTANEIVSNDDFGLFGQVQKTYDSNGETETSTYYVYDAFGRLVKEVRPGDSLTSPTSRYVYHDPTSPPPVANPGFESGLGGTWSEYDPSNIQTYTQDGTQAYVGSKSLKIVTIGTTGHWVGQYLSGWQAGKTYQVRAYVKTTASGKLCLQVSAKDGHEVQAVCRVASSAWELLVGTVTLPADATRFLLLLRTPQVGTVYVDEVYVTALYAVSAYAKEDAAGNILWQRQVYDGLGRVLQTQAEYNGAQATVVDQRYDARGLVVAQSVPYTATSSVDAPWYVAPAAPAQTLTGYNALGRVNQIAAPDGAISYLRYYGRQTATLDALGHLKISAVDAYGQLAEVREYEGTYSLPLDWAALEQPNNYYARTRYAYDTLGNLITVTDTLGNVTTMGYDKLSRKTSMLDPDMGAWQYRYDNAGNLVKQRDARNQAICFYYDTLNRLKGKTYHNNVSNLDTLTCNATTYTVTYTYDVGVYGIGRRTGMSDGSGSTSWTYDARGRVTQETKVINGGGTFKTQWGYDSLDRVTWMKYPSGNTGGTGEQVNYTYAANGALNSVSGTGPYVQSTAYDAAGRVTQRVLGNPAVLYTTYAYYPWTTANGQGRLQTLKTGTGVPPNNTSLQQLQYTYDAVGNVRIITDTLAGPQTQSFTYDTLDRLVTAVATGGSSGTYITQTYQYNQIGNLTNNGSGTLAYNSSTHKHAVTGWGSNTYGYDANGNQVTHTLGANVSYLIYDAENRLTTVVGATSASFLYDGDGNRVKSVLNGVTTYYVGNHFEWTGSTTSMVKYYYAGGQRVTMRKGSSTLYFLLGDHLGSTAVTVSSTGSKVAELRYHPWGGTRYTSGTTPTSYQFTGQRNDSYIGLYFYNARMYDPALGRFISPDSIVPAPQNPQTLNRYAYTRNNPIKYNDPTGHDVGCAGMDCGDYAYVLGKYGKKVAELPSSYVRINVKYQGHGWDGKGSGGVAIAPNAVLSHNHYEGSWGTAQAFEAIRIETSDGSVHLAENGAFSFAGDSDVGGGLSLFVFKDDFIDPQDVASMGDSGDLGLGDSVQQSVFIGGEPGLYNTKIQDFYSTWNLRGVTYDALVVSPDRTIGGDSGSPLYSNGYVYGVNNSGDGIYGKITNAQSINDLVKQRTEHLR